MKEDVYKRLAGFLNQLPAGFPATPTGIEFKILEKMFTPEQAELTMKLKNEPETVEEIAGRTGMDEAHLSEKLEKMAKDGLIFRTRKDDIRKYQAFQFVIGLYEFQLNRLDKEFCTLFEEYLPYVLFNFGSVNTSQLRVLPVESSLNNATAVAPYNQVRELIDKEEIIAVADCICKKEQIINGNTSCIKPIETCLMFGEFGQFYIDNNNARPIEKAEAYEILELAEANGLVLTPTNSQKLSVICCCCTCCCPILRSLKSVPNPGEFVVTYYRSVVDMQSCTGCGECITVCPMDAIIDGGGISEVLAKRCIGCGLCVSKCPVEAITMEEREGETDAPPMTFDEIRKRISAERGV